MKKKKSLKVGFIALALSTVMLSQSVPMEVWEVFAEELATAFTTDDSMFDEECLTGGRIDNYNIGNGYIVQENIQNRTLTTKEYIMSDDTIMVQQFTSPVHYYENGEYKEIDNTLAEETTQEGENVYTNKANSFKVKFKKENKKNIDVVEIEEDGYKLKVSYKAKKEKKVKTKIKDAAKKEKTDYKTNKYKRPTETAVLTGEISYEDIENNTNLTYKIKNNKLSENIIIGKSQDEYSYTFELQSSNLTFIYNEDGSITARNAGGQAKFVLPKPYMTDSNGKYNEGVTYTLTSNGNKTELTVTADADWINESASFPVTISPVIESAAKKQFTYANVFENGATVVDGAELYAGKKNGAEKSDVFLSFQLPKVEPYYQLLGAAVSFDYQTKGMGGFTDKDLSYNVYVAESTTDLSAISYAEKPTNMQTLNALEKTSQYSEKELSYESEIINTDNLTANTLTVAVESTDATTDGGYIALPMTVSETTETLYWYDRVLGIEDDYSMESFEIDGATAYVNNGTGYATAVFDLASVNTLSDMPFEASLVYNDNYNSVLSGLEKASIVGNNFKLNFQQFIIQRTNEEGEIVYELIDADGSISTFYKVENNLYYSKEKKLYYDTVTNDVYDLVGNHIIFDDYNRLRKILSENNPTEYILIDYVTAGNDAISQIRYFQNSIEKYKMLFTYEVTTGLLAYVTTDADSQNPYKMALTYDANNNLIEITNKTTSINNTANTGVKLFTLGYSNRYFDGEGTLNCIYSNQKNGLNIYREIDGTIYEARKMNAIDAMNSWRSTSYVSFGRYGSYTKIYYYEDNVLANSKYVAFNNTKKAISEWTENANGIVSVSANNNWQNESSTGEAPYTEESCSYYHKVKPMGEFSIGANSSNTKTIDSSLLGVQNNALYVYAVNFKVYISDIDTEINAGLNFTVEIGGTITETISLTKGGNVYISIPCGYYSQATQVTITNNGTQSLKIAYFSYAVVDCAREDYAYDSTLNAHLLTSTTTNLRSGNYIKTTYDEKQRVYQTQTTNIEDSAALETTTYAYKNSGEGNGKLASAITKNGNNNEIEKIEYGYETNDGVYTETVKTTQGSFIKQSSTEKKTTTTDGEEIKQTDENNVTTKGYYKIQNGDIRLSKVMYGNTTEQYTYNDLGQITSINVYMGASDTPTYSQTNNYENGVYLGSSYVGTTYTYGYDDTGYVTSIKRSESITPMLEYIYNAHSESSPGIPTISSNRLQRKTYANGDTENYGYTDSKTTLTYEDLSGNTQAKYEYSHNTQGSVTSQRHIENGYTALEYDYGELDNLEKRTYTIDGLQYAFEYTERYDTHNNRVKQSEIFSMYSCQTVDSRMTYYTYDAEGRLSELEYDDYKAEYEYDEMCRISNKTVGRDYATGIQEEDYVYRTYTVNGITYTTNQLVRIEDSGSYQNGDRTARYNANGEVIEIGYNYGTYEYTYDDAGRLASETVNGVETNYSYNSANNITQAGNKTFAYDNQGRLVQVGNYTFTYDALGNPTTYKGNEFTWKQGRKLVSGSMNGNEFEYIYDGNGMRYEKLVNGVRTEYYWNGTQLLMENRAGERSYFIYDVTGIAGMIYQYKTYYFDKNTLGDIVAVRDYAGRIIAKYEYDAWGNHTVYTASGIVDTDVTSIGNINPFRYRGYYYDVETGFYYLQTRYYDPTICRFINADNYGLVSQLASSKELNMFAYCRNNPIMYTDPTGEGWILALILIGSAVAGGIWNGIESYEKGNRGGDLVLDVFIGAGAGLATAGFVMSISAVGYIGFMGASASAVQFGALGFASFNLGSFTLGALLGIEAPEPIEMPTRPTPPIYSTPITGY